MLHDEEYVDIPNSDCIVQFKRENRRAAGVAIYQNRDMRGDQKKTEICRWHANRHSWQFLSGKFRQQTAVSCIPLHAVFVELQPQM